MFLQQSLGEKSFMTVRKTFVLVAGLVALLSGAIPAFAQDVDFDVDVVALQPDGPDMDFDLLANRPDFGPGFAVATPGAFMGKACPIGGGGPFSVLQGDLALSDDQAEKLYALKNDFCDKAGPKMLELRTYKRQMKDLMMRPTIDRQQVLALQDKINANKVALCTMKTEKKLNALEVLTTEQRAALRREMIKGCPLKGKMHHHMRHHG